MNEQMEMEELSQVIDHEREDQIKQLTEQLAQKEEEARNLLKVGPDRSEYTVWPLCNGVMRRERSATQSRK